MLSNNTKKLIALGMSLATITGSMNTIISPIPVFASEQGEQISSDSAEEITEVNGNSTTPAAIEVVTTPSAVNMLLVDSSNTEWSSTDSITNKGDTVTIDKIKFTLTDTTNKYVSVTGQNLTADTDLVLPSQIQCKGETFTITSIGDNAFEDCSSLKSIEMPSSVTSIGRCAFAYCRKITSVDIPSGVENIKDYAFLGCERLISIKIPSNVKSIGEGALRDCIHLTNITVNDANNYYESKDEVLFNKGATELIQYPLGKADTTYQLPNSVTNIGMGAFANCAVLTNIEIPNGVTSIESSAFYGCRELTSIEIPSSVTIIGNSTFLECGSEAKYIVYNDTVKGYLLGCNSNINDSQITVATLDTSALAKLYNDHKTDTKGSSTTDEIWSIFEAARDNAEKVLNNTNATQTEVDKAVQALEESLSGLGFEIKVTAITVNGADAISELGGSISLTASINPKSATNKDVTWSITSGDTLASISEAGVFTASKSGNGSVNVRATSKENASTVYGEKTITVSNNVLSDGFTNEGDTVTIDKIKFTLTDTTNKYVSVTGQSLADDTDLVLPSQIQYKGKTFTVTSIGDDAFMSCSSLKSIGIPSSVTIIGNFAFMGCSRLKSIEIPSSVTSIGLIAFGRCENLINITVNDANNYYEIKDGVLFNKGATKLIQYPIGKTDTTYVIPSSVTSIEDGAFAYCSSITSIKIPSNVKIIGNSTFMNCSNLTSIEILNGLTSIGDTTFMNCSSLKSIVIPNSVTSIGSSALMNCSSLNSMEIPSSVTNIQDCAFMNCSSLKSIVIPNSVTSIGNAAFMLCNSEAKYTVYDMTRKGYLSGCNSNINDSKITVATLDTSALAKLYNDHKADTKGSSTTDEIWNIFKSSRDNAEEVLNNTNATQTEVDKSLKALEDSLNGLEVKITAITVTGADSISQSGGSTALAASVTPENATNKNVTWSIVSGDKLATISETGVLTASKSGNGSVKVRATSKENGSTVYGEKTITLSNNSLYTITASADENGSITPSGNVSVAEGKSQTYAITPNTGYSISDVLVDKVSVGAVSSYTFDEVIGGHTISVTFNANSKSSSHSNSKKHKTVVAKSDETIVAKGDETSISDSIKNANTKVVVINLDSNNTENTSEGTNASGNTNVVNGTNTTNNTDAANNTPLISKVILEDLKVNTDKTLVIKTEATSIEIKSTQEGQIQITQNEVPLTGFATVANAKYYLNSYGIMQTDWVKDTNGSWYYLDKNTGAMKTGWLNDNGTWYYLNSNGVMKTGWLQDSDGKWYYLNSNGSKAVNTTIDGYYVNASGVWVK